MSSIGIGCCWAFAITAAYALKNKREIVSLSKQQLIDCMYTKYKKASYFADLGEKECFSCSYNKAYKFAMDYGITRIIKINGFQRVSELIKELEEKAKEKLHEKEIIEKLIRQQPITCAALHVPSLQLHRGKGVYMGPTENEIAQVRQKETEGQVVGKHAMLIVGYGEEEGVEFYLVKNSWGTEWGYQGYAKIKQSALSKLSYPIID
ncbi:ervatamin-B-like [Solanum stenotomum]|uniref:ervatamin-B-like n=1 Tax=Solanum stenotomum TaxID=172797 RepID=UPI0020D111F0|nr:ervatamin-B-like [Solanum stenotomum]